MSTLRPQPTESDLAELFRLHGSVRYLDAFHFAQTFAAPEEWRDTRALILAGRLFSVWGDSARSNRLHFRAWRAAPQHPEAIYFHGLTIEWRHGPFEALRFLHEQRTHFEAPREPTIDHAWLWLRKARLLATFRDFEAAEVLVQRAEPLGASDPWFWVERSRLRQQQDRYADALADAEQAMAVQPNYRPAVETLVDLFMLLNRDADALALLHRCAAHMQSGSLAQTRALLHSELEQHAEALVALDQAVAWTPAADEANRRWFAARRADALRGLNRDAEAAEEARRAKHGFHDHVAERLRQPAPPDKPRRLLRVEFVRQHHMTCAPATLSALGSYWQRPIDHLALAQVICYDGTPDHEERHWAEANGWIVREFRVTWECSVALLKRGCPFTLTTVATRSAHLQAVVGCDERLGLLLIRDPYQRTHGECVGEAFLQGCASHGPRGMVLVPPERAELLAGIELPDAPLYDRWYRLRRALERHDRNAARAEAEALEAAAPGHLLALKAQRELASYDGHTLRRIETTRALLKLFPDDPNFLLDEAQLLRVAGHLGEWRERVEALGRRRPVNALFLREFVEMLGEDARRQPQALREARRVLRRFSTEPGNLRAFAGLLWSRKEFGLATEIYRLAACVGDKTESHWDTFFSASRHTQQVDKCIELLRQREARLGARSSQPVRTLFRAYETLDRTHEGFDALRRALELRPDDGELQLYAAENFGRFGRFDEAAKCIAAAANRVSASLWLRSNARLSEYRMDFAAALKFWREVLVLNPIDAGAHQAAAGLIATLEGRPAARRFLREACDQHPNHVSLHTTFLEWVRSEPPEEALSVAERLLALDPTSAWAWREKAQALRRQHRGAEALAAAETAQHIEPTSAFSAAVRGLVLLSLDREADARAAYEEALRLNLDCGYISHLMETCRDFAQRSAAIAFLQQELLRQPVLDGGTFLKFREVARVVLPPEELRAILEKLLAVHEGNWGIWSALGAHLLEQRNLEAALARARGAVERFPLVPRAWIDLATIQSHAPQPGAEIESLNRALELSPAWGHASRQLSQAHERALQLDAAEHALRRAISADPLDGINHAWLADLLWRRGRQEEALPLMEHAITLEPGFDWAWQRFDEWGFERKDTTRVTALAEAITQARPADPRAWFRLARIQSRDAATGLATLERALALDPRNIDAIDLKAELLVTLKRFDDAIAACNTPAFGAEPPREMLGRAAWVEHERGDVNRAIEALRQVVAKHPDYRWGWALLTEWYWDTSQVLPTIDAATKWTWLSPHNAVALGYLALAQAKQGNRREAKEAYWRALRCDPNYEFGARELMRLLAEDSDLEEAARLLRHISTHLSPAEAGLATVRYQLMRRDREAAGQALATLAPLPNIGPLRQAVKLLAEKGWNEVVEQTLGRLLNDPKTNPAVGSLWVAAWPAVNPWLLAARLGRITEEPVLRHAWQEAIERLGQAKRVWWLRWFCWRRGAWFRRDTGLWGTVGYALSTAELNRATVRWLQDYRERADAEPWMLHNLVFAHFTRNQPDHARPVIEHALTLQPDNTHHRLLNWQGLEAALRGDTATAAASLERTAGAEMSSFMKFERRLVEILVEFEQAVATAPVPARRKAHAQIGELWAASPVAHTDSSLAHFMARATRHVGRRSGSRFMVARSYLPRTNWRKPAAPASDVSETPWWVIWLAVVVFSSLVRACVRS